jgi:pimeloyl-ACP methyl ester carboxylesterase
MRRRWTIGIGVVLALLALLVVNALVVDGQTESAQVTEPGGRILRLPDGEMQVVERGPRGGSPIVLIHCFSCAINWWDRMLPMLERKHRVVAVDLLGHGGSEKPSSGYTIPHQADTVAEALERLGARGAEVVGHSLGGSVAVAVAERHSGLASRVVIVDTGSGEHDRGSLGLLAGLAFQPVIGEALWQIKPDFATRKGLQVAFAPGFDVPNRFVTDVNRMTYSAYDDSPSGSSDYSKERPLDLRMRDTGLPLMVLMGAEEQIVDDPEEALAEYRKRVPGVETHLIAGAGHSPNVEKPRETARLVLRFAQRGQKQVGSSVRDVTERGHGPQQSSRRDVAE